MDIIKDWALIRQIFRDSFNSSAHYAIASVAQDGSPHVTPIGSLILTEPGKGIYFEKFTSQLPQNYRHNPNIAVLAVNSSRWFWFKSLLAGKFSPTPAIRLKGTAGEKRPATDEECARWQKRVKALAFTRGHKLIWRDMSHVRELHFHAVETVKIGKMTV